MVDAYYSAWAVPSGCISGQAGRSAFVARRRKFRRSNACCVVIRWCAAEENLRAYFARTVTSSCAISWPVRCSRLCRGMGVMSGVNTSSQSAALFPLFLKLEGKRCLVVGAGLIGLEKVESWLRCCRASIRVVAPHAVARVQELSAQGLTSSAASRLLACARNRL